MKTKPRKKHQTVLVLEGFSKRPDPVYHKYQGEDDREQCPSLLGPWSGRWGRQGCLKLPKYIAKRLGIRPCLRCYPN